MIPDFDRPTFGTEKARDIRAEAACRDSASMYLRSWPMEHLVAYAAWEFARPPVVRDVSHTEMSEVYTPGQLVLTMLRSLRDGCD